VDDSLHGKLAHSDAVAVVVVVVVVVVVAGSRLTVAGGSISGTNLPSGS